MPLDAALRKIAELEFNKFDLGIVESLSHIRPSEIAENPEAAAQRLRAGPSLTPAAFEVDFGAVDEKTLAKRFEAVCRFAKQLTVAVISIPAGLSGASIESEAARLRPLADRASLEGLVLTVPTHSKMLTSTPQSALALCQAVPGLGLSLDPSHFVGSGEANSYDDLFPYTKNIRLRDTGRGPADFQVLIGQGEIEYGRIITQLERVGYDRGLTISILDQLENPFEVEVEVRKLKRLLESLI
jgi:sugar phosphate isomerase/epimerase